MFCIMNGIFYKINGILVWIIQKCFIYLIFNLKKTLVKLKKRKLTTKIILL